MVPQLKEHRPIRGHKHEDYTAGFTAVHGRSEAGR
jgi:hypothetical protein